MAWSEYRQGKWWPKQVSENYLVPFQSTLPKRHDISFSTNVYGNVLNINVILTDPPDPSSLCAGQSKFGRDKDLRVFWMDGCGR